MQNHPKHQQANLAFSDEKADEIVGRMPRSLLWFAVFWIAFGLVFAACAYFDAQMMRNPAGRIGIIVILLIFFWLPGLLWMWMLIRVRVIADETGLRWRGMGGWKIAPWMQVRDYYIKKLPKSSESYIVETEAGKLDLKDMTHGTLLRQVVEERARWAETKSWEERESKNASLELTEPETFKNDGKAARDFWIMAALVLFGLPLLMTLKVGPGFSGPLTVYHSIIQTWQTLGPLWALATLAIVWFPGLVYGLMLFAMWPIMRATRERKGQSITVTQWGITWCDASTQREIKARWEEVRDFYLDDLPGWVKTAARGVVKTTRGDFDFVTTNNSGKRNGNRLQALIQKYCAHHGLDQKWRVKSESQKNNSLGAALTFSYRDSPLRSILYLVAFLALTMCFVSIARYVGFIAVRGQAPFNPADLLMGLFFGGPLMAASVWMWRQYIRFQLHVDEHGLTEQRGNKQRFIAWPDVQEYEAVAGLNIIRSEIETIRFYSALGRASELQKIIQQRATNSRTHSW